MVRADPGATPPARGAAERHRPGAAGSARRTRPAVRFAMASLRNSTIGAYGSPASSSWHCAARPGSPPRPHPSHQLRDTDASCRCPPRPRPRRGAPSGCRADALPAGRRARRRARPAPAPAVPCRRSLGARRCGRRRCQPPSLTCSNRPVVSSSGATPSSWLRARTHCLYCCQRRTAVSGQGVEPNQLAMRRLVERLDLDPTLREPKCRLVRAARRLELDQAPQRRAQLAAQHIRLSHLPVVEFRAVAKRETLEKVAGEELHRLAQALG